MIICTKCGASNVDESMTCRQCGHKLQSTRRESEPRAGKTVLSLHVDEETRRRMRRLLGPYIEAWAYALILITATVSLLFHRLYWPLYLLAPLLYLVLRWRKL